VNRVANVIVREEAVADQAGEVPLFIGPANHRGTSSMRSLPDSSGVLEVPKGRLDDLLPAGERVRLIKIDIERAEYLALDGDEPVPPTGPAGSRHRGDELVLAGDADELTIRQAPSKP
jgi:FkbM family methyltransferase